MAAAHAIRLESTADREAYDTAHPPLALLRIRETGHPVLEDGPLLAQTLRRELEEFLRDRGAPVYQPSDLNRADFTADHAYHPLLDGPRPGGDLPGGDHDGS
ncbi:hypothetical protein [Actinoplanes sp. NPDC051851]|uniref:hypothetical protein n=1 Tax=Actinoplanes sp. NPDC051851 TaxID=3154753 RepID=UPI00341C6A63